MPLPAQHVPTIFRICHFSHEEQETFLQAYRQAHPAQSLPDTDTSEEGARILRIEVPHFDDPKRQEQVIETIYEFAARLTDIARRQR